MLIIDNPNHNDDMTLKYLTLRLLSTLSFLIETNLQEAIIILYR